MTRSKMWASLFVFRYNGHLFSNVKAGFAGAFHRNASIGAFRIFRPGIRFGSRRADSAPHGAGETLALWARPWVKHSRPAPRVVSRTLLFRYCSQSLYIASCDDRLDTFRLLSRCVDPAFHLLHAWNRSDIGWPIAVTVAADFHQWCSTLRFSLPPRPASAPSSTTRAMTFSIDLIDENVSH
jgi:hypothetical protein